MLTKEQRDFLLPKAYNAALRAGAVILDIYLNRKDDYDINIKSDNTPITVADRNSHQTIRHYLGQTRLPLLSEEGREMLYAERVGWDMFWLVDPLDGTKEFIKGNGEFTVNIALMMNNKPVMGVVYVPHISKIYFCELGLGVFRKQGVVADLCADQKLDHIMEGAQLLPLTDATNKPRRIAVSRSHYNEQTAECIDRLREKFPDAVVVEQGSSYKFCLLAEGTVDHYFRTSNTYEWDTAAGEIILEMAGGCSLSLHDSQPLLYNKENLLNPHFECRSKHAKKG